MSPAAVEGTAAAAHKRDERRQQGLGTEKQPKYSAAEAVHPAGQSCTPSSRCGGSAVQRGQPARNQVVAGSRQHLDALAVIGVRMVVKGFDAPVMSARHLVD